MIALFGALAAAALADDVSNNLDGTVDAVAEVMPLTTDGSAGTTQLYVVTKHGDGKNGCNLTGGTILTVSVSSSDESVASVSPSSITFTSCGATPVLTVTPHAAGSATISVAKTANTTGATFDLAPATFTVNVAPPPNTPPTVSIAGVTGGTRYDKGAVPTATCEVTDAEDGSSSFAATLSAISGPYAADGIGEQTASCSYTDGGGLEASASAMYTIVDPTAPVIGRTLDPAAPDGANGWYVDDVSLTWSVSEPESPSSLQSTGCIDQIIAADQGPTTYSCSASSAGGLAGPIDVIIKRDAHAPTNIQFVGDAPADGGRYFPSTVPPDRACTAEDATSGIASCVVSGGGTTVGSHTLTATATDNAGNVATAVRTYRVRNLDVSGFFQPVDMGGVSNTVKGGSTVPMKFTVSDEGVAQTSTAVVASFRQTEVACASGAVVDDIEVTSTGGTSLRYDATARQFIQNWQTPKRAGACFKVTMTLIDDTAISAAFRLK